MGLPLVCFSAEGFEHYIDLSDQARDGFNQLVRHELAKDDESRALGRAIDIPAEVSPAALKELSVRRMLVPATLGGSGQAFNRELISIADTL